MERSWPLARLGEDLGEAGGLGDHFTDCWGDLGGRGESWNASCRTLGEAGDCMNGTFSFSDGLVDIGGVSKDVILDQLGSSLEPQ